MDADIREHPLYKEIYEEFRAALEPGFGLITGASDLAASEGGRLVAFTGSRRDKLEGSALSRICVADFDSGSFEEVTAGPHTDRGPAISPDGRQIAFLSDRAKKGQFGVYLVSRERLGEARAMPDLSGTAEYVLWSPDGARLLAGVAGLGSELAAVQGSGRAESEEGDRPAWIPTVDGGPSTHDFRRLHVIDPQANTATPVSSEGLTVWEAAWAGPARVLAIVSEGPTEDDWYSACLALIDVETGEEQVLYRSQWQLGLPAGAPSGRRLAVVEALCSDRAVVAGDLLLLDPEGGEPQRLDTGGVDVTGLAWRDDATLLYSGIRGLQTVVGDITVDSGERRELWIWNGSAAGFYPRAVPLAGDDFAAIADSLNSYPEIVAVRGGEVMARISLAHSGVETVLKRGRRERAIRWTAPDGLDIEGLVVTPEAEGPFPLVTNIHGGPTGSYRSRWAGPGPLSALVERGFAVFLPNPRGSSGRGQEFARLELHDVGGAELSDILTGIDYLVEQGIADPNRLGVMGGSHGGFMTAWAVTQTDRFGAAVSISPVTNWYSQHYTSNIGRFDGYFLGADPHEPNNVYFSRSPVLQARSARTPTLLTAGGVDRCTPPGQAQEFHQALLEAGAQSEFVLYPQEGHGVRGFPAIIDFTARVVDWFEQHLNGNRE